MGAYKALLLLGSPHSIFENRVTALGEANDFILQVSKRGALATTNGGMKLHMNGYAYFCPNWNTSIQKLAISSTFYDLREILGYFICKNHGYNQRVKITFS